MKYTYLLITLFISLSSFSQILTNTSLFPITQEGKAGFIDSTGKVVIKPKYWAATDFSEGLAAARITGGYGYIDKEENFVIAPQYDYGYPFSEGLALVYKDTRPLFINKKGEKIFEFESELQPAAFFQQGCAVVANKDRKKYGLINKKGKMILDTICSVIHPFVSGKAIVESAELNESGTKDVGLIDTLGNFVLPFASYSRIEGPAKGYYKAVTADSKPVLLDKKGNPVKTGNADLAFKNAQKTVSFRQSQKDHKWGVADTNGVFIVQPQFSDIVDGSLNGDVFFFREPNPDKSSKYELLTGVASKNGSTVVKPILQQVDDRGFQHGLLHCVIEGHLAYIDRNGKVIWHEQNNFRQKPAPLNIDYKYPAYFYAYSKPDKKKKEDNTMLNTPINISELSGTIPDGTLSLTVNTGAPDVFQNTYTGMTVYLVNNTKDAISFDTRDHLLLMKVQATTSLGEWMDIEYLPAASTFLNNEKVILPEKQAWTFTMPVYEGDLKAKMRIELQYIDPKDKAGKKLITLYSNSFEGSVNAAQLWRKRNGKLDN